MARRLGGYMERTAWSPPCGCLQPSQGVGVGTKRGVKAEKGRSELAMASSLLESMTLTGRVVTGRMRCTARVSYANRW